jgi:transcriptional regulator with XRE-family HTH domain
MSEITRARNGSMRRQKLLARLLFEERKARKICQQEVARRLGQHQSFVSRLESGTRHRIGVYEFLDLAEAVGFNPTNVLKRIQDIARNGSSVALSNSLDKALGIVRAAGYRVSKPKPPKRKARAGPTFVCEFADGTHTRMTVSSPIEIEKLDWDRGVRLSRAAYQSRHPGAPVPPAIISVHFEQDGKVLAQRKGETNVVVRN